MRAEGIRQKGRWPSRVVFCRRALVDRLARFTPAASAISAVSPPGFRMGAIGWGGRVRAALAHAFAVPRDAPLTEADAALLTRMAAAVVGRGLAVPAVMALESLGPLAFLGGQALHALAPILDAACPADETARLAALLERRGGPRALIEAIEAAGRGRDAA